MLVSIVIPSHERLKEVKRLIKSIYSSNYKSIEIIVVDDSKSFDIKQELKEFKDIKIIHLPEYVSPSTARNIGIKAANGDFVFLVDDDNVLDERCIEELVKILKNYKDVGLASPFMYYFKEPNKIWCAGVNFNPYISKTKFIYRDETESKAHKDLIFCDFFVNAYMIKKEVIEKIGLLDDKNFPIHFEEADYSERLRKKGYKIVFVKAAKSWHDVPTEVKEKARLAHCHTEKRAYYCSRNRIIFYRKHEPKKVLFVFFTFSLWLVAAHHIKLILFNLNKPKKEKIKIIKSYIKGIIDGLTIPIK